MGLTDTLLFMAKLAYFVLPAVFAYVSPEIFKKSFTELKQKYRKTLVIFISAFCAILVQYILFDFNFFRSISLLDYSKMPILFGIFYGAGIVIVDFLSKKISKK